MARAARKAGWEATEAPMSDGGEGLADVLGGQVRRERVTGPLGAPVEAEWRLLAGSKPLTAVVEMALASGLALAGGPGGNRAMEATTAGTGELIMAAVAAGAKRVIVGCGGSATTDGGWGAIQAMSPRARLSGVELVAAVDVRTRFEDAARVFAAQKGASPAEVAMLGARLGRLRQLYRERFGVDVGDLAGSGAAGGLAGGLAALGARVVSGFELVAGLCGLEEKVAEADVVLTGEGRLDAESFDGKVVGGVAAMAARASVGAIAVVGEAEPNLPSGSLEVISLVEEVGRAAAWERTLDAVEEVVSARLARWDR